IRQLRNFTSSASTPIWSVRISTSWMTCPRWLIDIDPVYGLSGPVGPVQLASGKLGYGIHEECAPPLGCDEDADGDFGFGLADCGGGLTASSPARAAGSFDACPAATARPREEMCPATTTTPATSTRAPAAAKMATRRVRRRAGRRSSKPGCRFLRTATPYLEQRAGYGSPADGCGTGSGAGPPAR